MISVWHLLLFVICAYQVKPSLIISDAVMFYLKKDATWYLLGNIIFSLLHFHSSRPSISKHHFNAGKFVIILCLLLSGDIHPCPGPNGEVCPGFNKGRVLDSGSYLAERNSAVVQVRVSCSDRAPNINTMANNISHLFIDDSVVVMGDEAAVWSSWRGRLVDQKGAEHKGLVD